MLMPRYDGIWPSEGSGVLDSSSLLSGALIGQRTYAWLLFKALIDQRTYAWLLSLALIGWGQRTHAGEGPRSMLARHAAKEIRYSYSDIH